MSLFFFFSTPSAFSLERACTKSVDRTRAGLNKTNCAFDEVADAVLKQKEVVPHVLFHFGKREHLLPEAIAGEIPLHIWNKHIMPDPKEKGLRLYRRGLYATMHPEDAKHYRNRNDPWLIEIHIKSECTNPERVGTIIRIYDDVRFQKWFSSATDHGFSSLESLKSRCFAPRSTPEDKRLGRVPIPFTVGQAEPNDFCDQIFNRYFNETDLKVIQDHFVRGSWYIRDPNCIETIKGRGQDLAQLIMENDFLWRESCEKNMPHSGALLFMAILAESESFSDSQLEHLQRNIDASKLSFSEFPITVKGLNFYVYSNPLIKAYSRCINQNRFKVFQETVRQVLENKDYVGFAERLMELCPSGI